MMKSFLFLFPERERQPQQQSDEEEGAALVPTPQPPPAVDDDHRGGALHAEDDEDPAAAAAVKQQQQQQTNQLLDDDDQMTPPGDGIASSASKAPAPAAWWRRRAKKLLPTRSVGLVIGGLVVLALLVGSTGSWWIHLDYASSFLLGGGGGHHRRRAPHHVPKAAAELVPIPFSCGGGNASSISGTCHLRRPAAGTISTTAASSPSPSPSSAAPHRPDEVVECPSYFRFIHSDLDPWRSTGISREAVERGRGRAAFRLVIVGGRAYVETYHRVFQTRDTFTQWGIAQLLARYPGRVPDLDLMFNCEDMPEVRRAADAPPLFRYCKDDSTVDIVFPDWSFWGWPEVNIRPWAPLLEEMAGETSRLPWHDREPYAYWKGNPGVSRDRQHLLRCNDTSRWNTRVFAQDWGAAIRGGFKNSNLARQCTYRYKIFVRGRSWSVSEKYILACDSPVLLLDTPFKDFFSRGLVAGKHYWPIDPSNNKMCAAIKFAVDWGNAHPAEATRMAEEGSAFAREDLAMDYVYDYMLHLLTEYAKLLRYKPTVPEKAVELCPEAVACTFPEHGSRERDFMMQSRESYVAAYEACKLPPPFTDQELRDMAARDRDVRAKVANMMQAHHH